jgi:hypothetical protein
MNRTVRVLASAETLSSGIEAVATSARKMQPPLREPLQASLQAAEIVARLEAAGATLLAMPSHGYSTQLRQMKFEIVHTALEAYGWESARARAAMPSAADISQMDEAFGWLALIPEARHVLRRILGARALVHPLTQRHLYPWRRLATLLGADHKSVQRWHQQGVALLVQALEGAL